uniref:CUE domain-containing protein n=1 Tax=Tanacetum cinerariifolium TaxID=118510 RepID=A0A6L2LFN2_TANCI|nr:hypothetical protein [Tanacetum cinerariifolium]
MESVSIRRIQCVGYDVLGFLGVGTTLDIFQIFYYYIFNTAYWSSGDGVLLLFPSWSFGVRAYGGDDRSGGRRGDTGTMDLIYPMSAMVCGKRSYYEEMEASPVTKKLRSSSSSSPVKLTSSSLDRLIDLFPNLDNQLLEKALDENGNDLDSTINSLNESYRGYVEGNSGSAEMSNAATTKEYAENSAAAPDNIHRSGAEWVELFVTEMTNATSVDDARSRCMRMLESLEKSITKRAGGEAAQSLHKENMVLKEQIEALLRENTILKRAVAIQHERQKDYDNSTQEVQHLKQLVSAYQERARNLEVEKYALTMHLKQAQEGSSMPGRFHPDVF